MPEFVAIPARFNGPPASANGGYTCGVVAGLVGSDVVQVSLRSPPPLEQPLPVTRHEGGRVELHDGAAIVAEGEPAELLLEAPDPVSPEAAAAASQEGLERWTADHPFPTCVVCGPGRGDGDGYRVFPGELAGQPETFAAPWTPHAALGNGDGYVRSECVWAALDCPTSAPVANYGQGPPLVLARLTARLGCQVRVGEPYALVSWPLALDGRKRHAACALFDEPGRLICSARALWIELRE